MPNSGPGVADTSDANATAALQYVRSLLDNVSAWYESADRKAQIVLSLDGAYLGFLTTLAIGQVRERKEILAVFGPETWVMVAALAALLAASILSTLACLRSRTYSARALDELFARAGVVRDDARTYGPEVMRFFQMIAALDPKSVVDKLQKVDAKFETQALAWQVIRLSANVTRKHAWANRAFLLGGASFLMLLGATMSYVGRLAG